MDEIRKERVVRKTPVSVPENLDAALESLTKNLTPEKKAEVLALSEEEFCARNHFFLGMTLRNAWGLWTGGPLKEWFKLGGIHHADDMSSIILRCLHRDLAGVPRDVGGQMKKIIKWYQDNPPAKNHKKVRE